MSIYFCSKSRRQFLVGSGKAFLALPLLPSLFTEKAIAQQMTVPPRRMMLFHFEHDNINELWPRKSVATTPVGSLGFREIMLNQMGTVVSHSYPLANARYESLKNAGHLTYLRGFRQDGWNGCHGDMYLSAVGSSRNSADYGLPTADQVFENSATLYPQGTSLSVRKALRISMGYENKHNHKVGSTMIRPPVYEGYQILDFYNDVFGSLTQGTTPVNDLTNQFKSNILNRVMGAYNSFSSNRRISSEDRQRVISHLDLISDLQNNYATLSQNMQQITCTRPASPGNIGNLPVEVQRVYLNLLALAFRCGITKFGTFLFDSHDPQWIPNIGITNLHEAIHGDQADPALLANPALQGDPQSQEYITAMNAVVASRAAIKLRAYQNWWRYMCNSVADNFLAPLDQLEGDTGRTYLDNMITGFIATGGTIGGHSGFDSQQILIGSMGGRLRSGRYYNLIQDLNRDVGEQSYPYNSFMITLFQLMGIPPSEYAFATADGRGFGLYTGYDANYKFRNRFYSPLSEVLTGT